MEPGRPLPITIGMVGTAEPGNMGSAARSMAAFGCSRLMLIEPRRGPSSKDRSLAVTMGKDILHTAETVKAEDVEARLSSFDEIWGTTARLGRKRRCETARGAVAEYLAQVPKNLLILFGSERDGLGLDWLDRCHRLIHLPTREQHPLNLAQAVSIVVYEFRAQLVAATEEVEPAPGDEPSVSSADRQELLRRIERLLAALDYPSRALQGHPQSRHLQPVRCGNYSQGQARWFLGLIARLERRLNVDA